MCRDYSVFLDSLAKNLREKTPEMSNDGFNIFQILGVETDEVKACRFIGALLDPKEKHGLGETPLKLFLNDVLKVSNEVDPNARIVLEDRIKDDRRVDIVIYNGNRVYPIEAKIKAEDQESQLFDYYNHYFKADENKKIYYLTPTGWKPTSKSIEKKNIPCEHLSDKQIDCLSFKVDITTWLNRLKDSAKAEVYGIIEQYKKVIMDMCEKEETKKAILKAAGIEDGFPDKDSECFNKLKALIDLLSANGDTNGDLQRTIQTAYLKKNLKFDKNNFSLCTADKNHKYAVLAICETGSSDPIAWICIETNLYILSNVDVPKWDNDNWVYLAPNGYSRKNNKYPLNDCKNIITNADKPICIDSFLNDIINARDKKINT